MHSLAHNLQTTSYAAAPSRTSQLMRFASVLFILSALSLSAGELSVVRIIPEYRTVESFERISEFFDGKENTGGQTYLRSQPGSRAGFYFLTRLNNPGAALSGARIELAYVTPAATAPRSITFPPTNVPSGRHVFQVGLTGSDWDDADARPIAWRLRVLSADGRELINEQSFLWNQPSPR